MRRNYAHFTRECEKNSEEVTVKNSECMQDYCYGVLALCWFGLCFLVDLLGNQGGEKACHLDCSKTTTYEKELRPFHS
jgi:hypothetical protein